MTTNELANVLQGQQNLAAMGALPEYITALQEGTIMVYDNGHSNYPLQSAPEDWQETVKRFAAASGAYVYAVLHDDLFDSDSLYILYVVSGSDCDVIHRDGSSTLFSPLGCKVILPEGFFVNIDGIDTVDVIGGYGGLLHCNGAVWSSLVGRPNTTEAVYQFIERKRRTRS